MDQGAKWFHDKVFGETCWMRMRSDSLPRGEDAGRTYGLLNGIRQRLITN